MKEVVSILFCSLFISLYGMVLKTQDDNEAMAPLMADPNRSSFKVVWPGAGAYSLRAPIGLVDRLPPDGTWARFEQNDTFVTIASVGEMMVEEQPCRWIEVTLEEGGRNLVWKLLIQEKGLKRGRNILEQALSVWHREGREKPLNITGMKPMDVYGSLTFILTGPDQEIRRLAPQMVETKLGRFKCAGWTGRQRVEFDWGKSDTTYRQWVHDSAPFGVLHSEMSETTKSGDGRINHYETSIALVEVGTSARSRVSTANLSAEELTAQPFAPAAGWLWAIVPRHLGWSSLATRGLAMAIDKNDRELRFTLAHPWALDGAKYRPVAFDADQRRYEFKKIHGPGSGTVGLGIFALAQSILPTGRTKYIGLEKLSQQTPKEPPSLMGKSLPDFRNIGFNFVPERVDEKPILICCFDMDQRPSRNCMRELAKRGEALKEEDVIVVAVQASKVDENTLNDWVKKYKIPFPVGTIQGDVEKTKFAWGVKSLPWLILTDKQHAVQAEGFSINELDERITTLREK